MVAGIPGLWIPHPEDPNVGNVGVAHEACCMNRLSTFSERPTLFMYAPSQVRGQGRLGRARWLTLDR